MPKLGQTLRIALATALSTLIVASQAQAAAPHPTASSRAQATFGSEEHHAGTIEASLAPTLSALPEIPTTDKPVQLSVLNPPSDATTYRWRVAGDAEHLLRVASAPRVTLQFATAGIHRVTVLIAGRHSTQQAALSLRVRPLPSKPGPDVDPTRERPNRPTHSRPRPLKLSAVPANPTTGEAAHLSVLNGPPAANYTWKLAGSATHPLRLPPAPGVTVQFATPGIHRLTILMARQGATDPVAFTLRVRPRAPKHARHAEPTDQRPSRSIGRKPSAHAAVDPGVTIADFQFNPRTVTVHVGATITWTNDGPSAHTATARDGSFDTGLLRKGASASHTFSQAGTYTYFCRIHPFMHGTVIVLAVTTPPAASPRPGSSAPRPSGASTAAPTNTVPSAPSAALPLTGMSVAADATFGFLLVGLGLTLQRGARGQ